MVTVKLRFSPLEANVDKFDVETKNTVLINEPPVLSVNHQ